jgi:hypothetical protein
MIDILAIGGGVLKAALPKVAEAICKKINIQLNPTELEKILKKAINSAQ